MNRNPVTDLLREMGLDNIDMRIYIYLAKNGPHSARALCSNLELAKQRHYPSLCSLKQKGLIKETQEPPTFSAVPFENVLDLLIMSKIGEAQMTKQHKSELIAAWQSQVLKTPETKHLR